MLGSAVLDTVIGLVFVFLLVSMLVTIANEIVAAALLSRAKWLRVGIDRLLGSEWAQRLYDHPLIEGSAAVAGSPAPKRWSIRGTGPSYIPSRSFANVLLDLVRKNDSTLERARQRLQAALDSASKSAASPSDLAEAVAAAADALSSSAGVGATLGADLRRDVAGPAPGASRTLADMRAEIQRFIDAMPARYLRQVLQTIPVDRIRETLLLLLDDAENDIDKFK